MATPSKASTITSLSNIGGTGKYEHIIEHPPEYPNIAVVKLAGNEGGGIDDEGMWDTRLALLVAHIRDKFRCVAVDCKRIEFVTSPIVGIIQFVASHMRDACRLSPQHISPNALKRAPLHLANLDHRLDELLRTTRSQNMMGLHKADEESMKDVLEATEQISTRYPRTDHIDVNHDRLFGRLPEEEAERLKEILGVGL